MSTDDVLTPDAIELLHLLQRELGETRQEVLSARVARAQRLKQGELPDFLDETEGVRRGDWRVPPAPADLSDRRVEITGPTDRKMVINALNCGARVFMADFEDANSPTWQNMIDGQRNLSDAITRARHRRRRSRRRSPGRERRSWCARAPARPSSAGGRRGCTR
jgi:malate synthase